MERSPAVIRPGPAAAAALLLLLPACASPDPGFRWPVYDSVVYRECVEGGADPAELAHLLGAEMERTAGSGRPIPPGVRAHLGHLLLRAGDAGGAKLRFLEEKEAYPESAVFMDRVLAGLGP